MQRICGVYGIFNLETQRVYIGSSKDVLIRWSSWKNRLDLPLRRIWSVPRTLQWDWRIYGKSAFTFVVLEVLPERASKAKRLQREQHWICTFEHLYNTHAAAICNQKGIPMSKFRERLSLTPKWVRDKYEKNRAGARKGIHQRKSNDPLTKAEIKDIRKRWQTRQATQTQLAVEYRVSQVTISRIVRDNFRGIAA